MASTSAAPANVATDPKVKGSYSKCCFTGCGLTKIKNPQLHFFRFPVNRPPILEQWLVNCGNESLINLPNKTLYARKVCDKHFTLDCFTNDMKKYLKKDAVPTMLNNDDSDEVQEQTVSEAEGLNNDERVQLSPPEGSQLLCQTTASPKTPTTPEYKKFKSAKNRTPTPRKRVLTPMKRRLLSKLKSSEKKKKMYQTRARRIAMRKTKISKQELVSAIHDYLPPAVSKFVSMQINHANSKKKTWSEEERRIALSMSYISPRFYEHMRKDGFALPSKSTIARWLQEVDLRPGICQDLVNTLKAKVECMTEWEKKSVILFDEMQIKTSLEYDSKRDVVEGLRDLGELGRSRVPGTKVLLFMARGLIHRWKMPFAYFVVNDSIKSESIAQLVKVCVATMLDIGLDIKSVVCDQSSTNRGAAKMMGVSLKTPYFFCQNQKVYWIYDFPHIIKCIRNNLMKKNKQGQNVGSIETAKGVADWTHVANLYDLDKSSITARATKLSGKHINPNSFEKMSVKLATQVFSHTVSAAMKTAVDANQLPPEAKETATFVAELNNIFDAMNSRTQFHPNPRKCAISNSSDPHFGRSLCTILEGVQWVKTWKMLHGKKRPPSFVGMEHTMRTTILLWKDIQKEGVSYLLTARLNQDPLENEFSIARQRCGYNRNPTARLFRQNLRHRIKCAVLQPSTGSNCEPDEDELIEVTSTSSSLPLLTTGPTTSSASLREMEDGEISYEDSDASDNEAFDRFSTTAENKQSLEACSVRFFAGYVIRACMKKDKCQICWNDLVKPTSSHEPDEVLIKYREYKTATGDGCEALISPSNVTVNVENLILQVFDKIFVKNICVVGIRKRIEAKCKQIIYKDFPSWMKCGTACYEHRMFFVKKSITVKLHWKLQELSKEMRQPGGKYGGYYEKVKILGGN